MSISQYLTKEDRINDQIATSALEAKLAVAMEAAYGLICTAEMVAADIRKRASPHGDMNASSLVASIKAARAALARIEAL